MAIQQVNQKKILLLYRTFGPSVNLCGYAQLKWLASSGRCQLRHKRILEVKNDDLNWAEIVAFVRGDALLDEKVAALCHRAGKTLLYILDDDLLHVPEYLGSGPYYSQKSVKRHIKRMMQYSDALASPSPILLQKYKNLFAHTFQLIEPSLFCRKNKPIHKDGKVRIGFAGSSDRGSDIDLILSEVLTQICEKYGDSVSIEFFGVHPQIAETIPCTVYPYHDSYEFYQQAMQKLNWDIGLAPMPDTDFHSCKHFNKLVEYAGFGVCGVYSDVLPYRGAVQNQYNGLLCPNTTDAWVTALIHLIENHSLRQSISQNCLKQANTVFSVPFAAKKFEEAIAKLPVNGHTKVIRANLPLIKVIGLASWYLEKFKKYGWKTPVIAVRKAIQIFKREV